MASLHEAWHVCSLSSTLAKVGRRSGTLSQHAMTTLCTGRGHVREKGGRILLWSTALAICTGVRRHSEYGSEPNFPRERDVSRGWQYTEEHERCKWLGRSKPQEYLHLVESCLRVRNRTVKDLPHAPKVSQLSSRRLQKVARRSLPCDLPSEHGYANFLT